MFIKKFAGTTLKLILPLRGEGDRCVEFPKSELANFWGFQACGGGVVAYYKISIAAINAS